MSGKLAPLRGRIRPLVVVVALGLLGGCASVPPVDPGFGLPAAEAIPRDQIRWPEQYRPEDATFFVHNEIEIAAPPEVVWDVIVRAEDWPAWYEGAADVEIQNSPSDTLQADSVFTWRTMGRDFTSSVREFAPPYRLSWESRRSDIQGYHAWLLVPTAGGTRLVTDESQHGLLASAQKVFLPNKLRRLHDSWLIGIRTKAEGQIPRR